MNICLQCGKNYKRSHTCKKPETFKNKLKDIENYKEFWNILENHLKDLNIKIEFDEYPTIFSDNAYDSYEYKGPGWSGRFVGKIESEYDISFSNVFGWFDSLLEGGVETGSGCSGERFSMSNSRIDMRLFPKMYKEWERESNYFYNEREQISDNIKNVIKDRKRKSHHYAEYSEEYRELYWKEKEIRECLVEISRVKDLIWDKKVKEFQSNNPIDLPDPKSVSEAEYFELKKLNYTIPEMEYEDLQHKVRKIVERLNKLKDYIKNHPQYFI